MKSQLDIVVPVVTFKDEEDGIWYAYCPVLEITGYGTSKREAEQSFSVVLKETMTYLIEHGTLEDELRRLGWTQIEGRKVPPSLEERLASDAELRRMMTYKHQLRYNALPALA